MRSLEVGMKKLQQGEDVVYIFKNYLSKKECERYANMINDVGIGNFDWSHVTRDITQDPIVLKTQKFLNKKFKLKLKISQAQTQNWNQTSSSPLHVHDDVGRENTTYSSSIYLNEGFEGGLFYTKHGIRIKPEIGLLTFFDGGKVWHGVEEVKGKDRKSLIFWWKNETK